MSNLCTNCYFDSIFKRWTNIQEVSGYHDNKHHKNNQFESLDLPGKYFSWEYKFNIKESYNLVFCKKVYG